MTSSAVFAYGSLVDPASASLTLGRPVEDAVPAELPGWRRAWTTARDNLRFEKSFRLPPHEARRLGLPELPQTILLLNIQAAPAGDPALNGALIPVDERELALLDDRERRYRRVDVTGDVSRGPSQGASRFTAVHAYLALPRFHRDPPPAGGVVVESYSRAVEAAFAALGPDQLARYRRTTEPPLRVARAELVRDETRPRNPSAW